MTRMPPPTRPRSRAMQHGCPWPTCARVVPPHLWGCKPHWYRLPAELRARILGSYRVGQNIATASDEYRAAIRDAARWIYAELAAFGE